MADEVVDRLLDDARLDARDRALVLELVYGVLRHRRALDWRLDQVADQRITRLPPPVRTALRLAAYQLFYLDRIPAFAAVNESVALMKARRTRKSQGRDWSGYINAVLRALVRKKPMPDTVPGMDPVSGLSLRYSCPAWLTRRWVDRCGLADAEGLCRAAQAVPPLTLRANILRIGRDDLVHFLAQAGFRAHPTMVSPVGVTLEGAGPVPELPGFAEGFWYVEDEGGQLVAPILDPQPGEWVLDACAAPGGKATHLAALMQNRGRILALDRSEGRLRLLQDNARRLGLTMLSPIVGDASCGSGPLQASRRLFDRLLVDAPCSGLGVLRRHPEGKWQKQETDLAPLHAQQVAILSAVSRLLRPGGVLVYSTCSTEPEENTGVVDQFCRSHAEFRRESVAPWVPPAGRGYVTSEGDLLTMPSAYKSGVATPPPIPTQATAAPAPPMDVFFVARLRKADR